MIRRFIGSILLFSAMAWGQSVSGFYQDRALGLGPGRSLTAIPGAVVTLCQDDTCQIPASMYSDQAFQNPITFVVSDTKGNFNFFAVPGFYYCEVVASNYATSIYPCLVDAIDTFNGDTSESATGSGSLVRESSPTVHNVTVQGGATIDTINLTGTLRVPANATILASVAGNTDMFGVITLSTGAGSYTFQGSYANAPICQVQDPANHTLAFTVTTTTLSVTGGTGSDPVNYHCFGAAVPASMLITTATPLTAATHNVAYSTTLVVSGGTPPYSWTVPSTTVPGGAIDVLDYFVMPLPDRNNFHLNGNTPKYFHLDAGLLWWIKGPTGNPWDGLTISNAFISQWFTENVWSNASSYKMYDTPIHLWPRYFVPGTDIVTTTAGPNKYKTTTNCGADNQAEIDNLDVKGELQGPFTDVTWHTTYGGDIPDGTSYLLATKYIKGTSGIYASREQYWGVLGFGQARWCPSTWNGTTYVQGTCSTNTAKISGGSPTPNFACKVPTVPVTNNVPAGTLVTTGPSLNLDNALGNIVGTPTTAGTYGFTVQVEDAVGHIAQKTFSLTVN